MPEKTSVSAAPRAKLTTWEAACIITGYGIGSGVLSMPYLTQKTGFPMAMVILLVAFAASYVLHLMIADLALKSGENSQIIACLSRFLFRGKLKKFLTVLFFVLMTLILFTNLAAYIAGAEELIVSLLPVSGLAAKLMFYALAAAVVLFGLKAVGVSEKVAVAAIFVLIGTLAVASFIVPGHGLPMESGTANYGLAYYGMAMFSMAAFFSVPQAVEGLGGDEKKIRKAIFTGLFNNLIIIVVITVCSLVASDEVTELAMVGWSAALGPWAQIVGSLFTVFAMLTTYWSLSLALGDIVEEQLRLGPKLAWVAATVPSLLLALLNFAGFMEFMRLAGGLISIIIAVMVVPAYRNARNDVEGSVLKKTGGKITVVLIILAYILMAVGSVVPV